jgi:hypothetical protein
MALARCVLGKFLGVGCHSFPPPLEVPTISARFFHVQRPERPLAAKGGTIRGREMFQKLWPRIRILPNYRDLLDPAKLRHGTDGFTSPPKESAYTMQIRLESSRIYLTLCVKTAVYFIVFDDINSYKDALWE